MEAIKGTAVSVSPKQFRIWANRVSNENAKVSKKLRPIAQNSGHVARSLEHQIFLSIIENYIRYSVLHHIFCVKVPSSGCILFHN